LSGTHYDYIRDPEFACNIPDPFDAVYKDLLKKHHVLRRSKRVNFAMQRDFQVKVEKVHIYILEVSCELRQLFAS
jgi:hypothetical protein